MVMKLAIDDVHAQEEILDDVSESKRGMHWRRRGLTCCGANVISNHTLRYSIKIISITTPIDKQINSWNSKRPSSSSASADVLKISPLRAIG
jgi:hypothetical protein